MRFTTGKIITRITAGLLSVVLLSSTVSSRFVIAADFSTHPELAPEELTKDATQSTDVVNANDADVSNSNSVDLGNGVVISEANPKSDESTTTDNSKENADSDNNDYSIKLQGDTSINLNDTLNVSSDVITAENTDGTDKSYSVDYSVDNDNVITNVTDNNAEFNFTEAGTYTIDGKLIVDGNEVSTDTMVVEVKEPQPTEGSHSITFDHYYSVIDESVVTTPELLVTTKDASVFSENTNIVSQFDDAYIISCASIQEARYMYSYYVDKVDHISDLSQAFATSDDTEDNTSTSIPNVDALNQLNEAVKSTESVDYSDYIALIDSGADADANFSVIGDDTTDTYGHGTRMLDLIKSENPNAKVLSIKAFNGKTTDAASVYAAIRLAINNNVKIINLSLVAADVDKNAVVKDIIQEAIDKGITVVGAAGNYNLSASRFIPGSIADVITIGACDTDGNKLANSNFDADYYIVANSTSEAAAIYTGLLSNGITENEKLYDKNLRPTKVNNQSINDSENNNAPTEDPYELHNDTNNISNRWLAEAFATALGLKCRSTGNNSYEFYYQPDDFELSAGPVVTDLKDQIQSATLLSERTNASYSGKCDFSEGDPGNGSAYNFTNSIGNGIFESVASSSPFGVYTSCDADWGNSTLSDFAKALESGTVYYKATVENIDDNADGKRYVTYDVLLSEDGNFDKRTWNRENATVTINNYHVSRTGRYCGSNGWENAKHDKHVIFDCGHNGAYREDGAEVAKPGSWQETYDFDGSKISKDKYMTWVRQTQQKNIKDMSNFTETVATPPKYKGIRYIKGVTSLTPAGTIDNGDGTFTYKFSMPVEKCKQKQIYRGKIKAWTYRYVYVNVQKNIDPAYMDLYNTGNYPIDTNTITLVDNGTPVKDINGNVCTFKPTDDVNGRSKKFTLDYDKYYNHQISAKETVGSMFFKVYTVVGTTATSFDAAQPNTVTVINKPIHDPVPFKIYKVSDKTGKLGQYNAAVASAGAMFKIDYFTDANRTKLNRSWTVKSDADGRVDLQSASNVVSGNCFINPDDHTKVTLPVGYYTITEVQSPMSNIFSHTGMYTNGQPYYLSVLPVNNKTVTTMTDASGTTIFTRSDGHTDWNGDYRGSIGDLHNSGAASVYQIEDESWRPLGILKTDSDLNDLRHGDDSLKIPQGSAAYAGAVYQLFSKTNKNAASMFDVSYNNPNNGQLSFGTNNTITATNGDGNKFNYTVNGAKPVLFNDKPVYVTLNQYGYGQTDISVPYDNDYVFYEVTAPSGYYVNTTPNSVSTNDWLTDSNGHAVNVKMTDFNGVEHDVVKITESSYRDGSTLDDVIRYGFALYKKDSTSSVDTLNNAQGDGSLNNIRFAVINRSTNRIILRDKYNTVDTGYSAIKNNTVIEPNQICAILTTHTHNGQEGYISMYGLPYGKYEIVELKRDAGSNDALIGAYYNSQGNSTYANNSYLWQNNDFHIDYTSDANKAYSGVNGISHFIWSYANNNADHIAQNKEFIDGFQGYKMDEDYLAVTEGDSDTNNIKYAVINRSNRSMEILASDLEKLGTVDPNYSDYISYTPSTQINPGSVVAVLTTHKGPNNNTAVSNGEITEGTHKNESADGYFSLYGLPYGRYEVVELRRDANVNPGDVWANTDKGTSIYANDSMYWKSYSYTYTLTDTADEGAHNDVRTALTKHNSPYANNSTNQYQNQAFRDGFSFWKRDLTYNKVSDHPQGDASFNDIRYAVVNVSDDNVKMFNKYTNMMPTVDRPNVEILDNVAIAPGQVCAIVTSHNQSGNELDNGNLQGYVALFGLPYGRYEIHELRADATIGVGDVYEGSDKLGTSIYANHLDNSSSVSNTDGSRSMLWNDTLFYYDLRDTEDGVHTLVNDVNNLHANDTTNDDDVWENEVVHGSIKIKKYDFETGLSDATQQQGENSLKGIAYAIVNRSKWSISYPYETTTGEDRHFEPGEVVDVLETDENGEIYIPYIPYGTYDIYELRIPQSRNKDTLTKGHQVTQHMVFDENAWKNGTNPDVYGNDERSNEYYSWNDNISHVSVINETSHEINPGYYVNPEKGRTIRTNEFENLNEYSNLPVRSDLFTIKVDIDGKRMGYVPWLISLVESDEDGKPILNDDGTYKVIEEHIAVTNDRGEINTRDWTNRPKTQDNVNQLDGLYNGVDFTGSKEQLKAAAGQNIWFGTYNGLNNQRGSLLEGTYIMQELRRSSTYGFGVDDEESYYDATHVLRRIHWNTEMYDMLSSRVIVTHDNMVYDPVDFDIPVNIPIYAKSDALDLATRSNSTTPSAQAHLRDTVHFGNLNGTQKYGYITDIWRVENDGTKHLLKESDMTVLDFTGDAVEDTDGKLCSVIKNADGTNTIIRNGYTLKYENGKFTAIKKPTNEDPVFNVLHDFDIVQDFEVDSSSCEEGERIAFSVNLYKSVGATGWSLVKSHNTNLDEPTQDIEVISFNTYSTNKTTGTRIGSLAEYAYDGGNTNIPLVNKPSKDYNSTVNNRDNGIVGYTIADDTLNYSGLTEDRSYAILVSLVDDSGECITDIYGNKCTGKYINLYIDNSLSEVIHSTSLKATAGTGFDQVALAGPSQGSIKLSDFGVGDFIIPNGVNAHFQADLLRGANNADIKRHNADRTEESEAIRWVNIDTTAMSEEGIPGIITNGKHFDYVNGEYSVLDQDAILRDKIHYTNLAEEAKVRVEGYVYLVKQDENGNNVIDFDNGTDYEYVAHESKVFDLTDVPEGNIEMQYTIKNSGQYSERQLVVCERVFMDVAGKCEQHPYSTGDIDYNNYSGNNIGTKSVNRYDMTTEESPREVLIAVHEDLNDKMQTVSVPYIKNTQLNNTSYDISYKNVSRDIANVKLTDTVAYNGLKTGTAWTLTAAVMTTDADNKIVPVVDAEGNNVVITKDFTPSKSSGEIDVPIEFTQEIHNLDWSDTRAWTCYETLALKSTNTDYAMHNNILDKDQTVYIPTLKTKVSTIYDGHNQSILPQTEQEVTDHVYIKNFGINSDVHEKYTLKMEAYNATTGEPILNADGQPYVSTKTYDIMSDGKDLYIDGEKSDAKLIVGKTTVADPTGNYGTDLPKYNTNLFGDDKKPINLDIDLTLDATNYINENIAFHETLYYGEDTTEGFELMTENSNDNADQIVYVANDPKIIDTYLADSKFISTDDKHTTLGHDVELTDQIHCEDLLQNVWYEMRGRIVFTDTGEPVLDSEGNPITGTVRFESDDNGIGDAAMSFKHLDTIVLDGKSVVAFQDCYYIGTNSEGTPIDRVIAKHGSLDNERETVNIPKLSTQVSYEDVMSTPDESAKDKTDWTNAKLVTFDGTKTDKVTFKDTVSYSNLTPGKEYKAVGRLYYRPSGLASSDKKTSLNKDIVDDNNNTTPITGEDIVNEDIPEEDDSNIVSDVIDSITGSNNDADTDVDTDANAEVDADVDTDDTNTEADTNIDNDNKESKEDTTSSENTESDNKYKNLQVLDDGKQITATTKFVPTESSGEVDVEFSIDASKYAGSVIVVFEDIYQYNDDTEKYDTLVARHCDLDDAHQGFTTTLLLHINLAKSDFSDKKYYLKNAEITIYEDKACTTILKDINGNDCISTTNKDGAVEFTIATNDEFKEYYAKETKAPFGYKLYKGVMKVTPTKTRESDGICPINMKMLDKIIIIASKRPLKTGDTSPIILVLLMLVICVSSALATLLILIANKKPNTQNAENITNTATNTQ